MTSHDAAAQLGAEVAHEAAPLPSEVLSIPGRQSEATHSLGFYANNLPPLGAKVYQIRKTHHSNREEKDFKIPSSPVKITYDEDAKNFFINGTNISSSFTAELLYYKAMPPFVDGGKIPDRASGAYIFRYK